MATSITEGESAPAPAKNVRLSTGLIISWESWLSCCGTCENYDHLWEVCRLFETDWETSQFVDGCDCHRLRDLEEAKKLEQAEYLD